MLGLNAARCGRGLCSSLRTGKAVHDTLMCVVSEYEKRGEIIKKLLGAAEVSEDSAKQHGSELRSALRERDCALAKLREQGKCAEHYKQSGKVRHLPICGVRMCRSALSMCWSLVCMLSISLQKNECGKTGSLCSLRVKRCIVTDKSQQHYTSSSTFPGAEVASLDFTNAAYSQVRVHGFL
jgi:hypothetical protein